MIKNEKKGGGTKKGTEKPYIQMSRRRAVGWMCAFMFLLAWIFTLGVMVGRGTAPVRFDIDKIQKDLAELKAEVLKKEKTIIKNRSDELLKKKDFEFHRKLTDSGDLLKNEIKRKMIIIQKEKNVVKKEKRRAVKKTTAPAEKKEKTIASGGYTIQVASLKEIEHAKMLIKKIKSKGYSAYSVAARLPGKGVWHRVRLGSFQNKIKAESALRRIRQDYKGAIIVSAHP